MWDLMEFCWFCKFSSLKVLSQVAFEPGFKLRHAREFEKTATVWFEAFVSIATVQENIHLGWSFLWDASQVQALARLILACLAKGIPSYSTQEGEKNHVYLPVSQTTGSFCLKTAYLPGKHHWFHLAFKLQWLFIDQTLAYIWHWSIILLSFLKIEQGFICNLCETKMVKVQQCENAPL